MRIKQTFQWSLGYSEQRHSPQHSTIPACVPGAVQLDWKRARDLPDYNFGTNIRQYEWMEKAYWHYKTTARVEDKPDRAPFLIFESIEYQYDILINGCSVQSGEGIYTPVVLDMANYIGQTIEIEVILHPAPMRPGMPAGNQEYSASCKAAFSYGWDWSPRMVALGICGDAYLEYRSLTAIEQFDVTYTLTPGFTGANITVEYTTFQQADEIRFSLFGSANELVFETSQPASQEHGILSFTLESPKLWWPNGHGEQNLYTAVLQTTSPSGIVDRLEKQIGFRRVKLVMNEGEWERIESLPTTQKKCPITIEINGRRIFAKGSNWVPPDFFLSQMTDEVYETLIRLAREAHMNILRVWGGGYVNHDAFFALCDRYGIMVWQEFPLACADYPDDESYLSVLDRESVSIIKKARSHPCLALWSGGNELFNAWSKMTNQSLALRLLGRNCYQFDRDTPFIDTSPLYGMGHGHYVMKDGDQEALQIFQNSTNTAYTEFGCAAPSPYSYLERWIPAEELEMVEPGGSYELHHAVNAWRSKNDWFSGDIIEYFCGKTSSVKEAAEKGVFVQSLMYSYVFEEIRKQWPYCSMALNWCFNEPWPTAAGNSLINYPAIPKPAYETVKNALRGTKVSIRPDKLLWWFAEECRIGLWILNDTPNEIPAGTITASLRYDETETVLLTWNHPAVPAMENIKGPFLCLKVPCAKDGRFTIRLETSQPELSDCFTLLCHEKEKPETIDTQF